MKNPFLLGALVLAATAFGNFAHAQVNCVPGVEAPGCPSQASHPNCIAGVESPGCPAQPAQPPVNCIPGVESPGCPAQPSRPQSPLFNGNFFEVKTWLTNPSYFQQTRYNSCDGQVTLVYNGGDQIAAHFENISNCTQFTIWARPGHGTQPFQLSNGRAFRLSTNQNTGLHSMMLDLTDYFRDNNTRFHEVTFRLTNDYGNVGNLVSVHPRDVQ